MSDDAFEINSIARGERKFLLDSCLFFFIKLELKDGS
jgi:hypothetical protein